MRSYSRNGFQVANELLNPIYKVIIWSLIVFITLFFIAACGGGSNENTLDGSSTSDDSIVNPSSNSNTNNNTELSCSGSRIWGPLPVESDVLYYVSETAGNSNPPDCAAFWEYDASQNCSDGFLLDPSVSLDMLDNGDVRYSEGEFVFQLPPANISLTDIGSLPDCNSNSGGGTTSEDNNDSLGSNDGSGEGTNGAAFGSDLPPYKDLVLINSSSFVPGLDGLLLTTIKQTPVMRFDDGSVTRDLTDWINGQRSSLGQWTTNASGTVTLTFDGQDTTSITAPIIASRSPREFYNCYDKVNSVSVLEINALIYNDYCFKSDGTFTSTGGSSNSGQSSNSGTYQVDGNVIRFSFNSGAQEIHLFGTYVNSSGDVYAVSIGEAVYNQ